MKKNFLLDGLVILGIIGGLVSCKDSGVTVTTDKEEALQPIVAPYVNNTVIATYSAMADEGLKLLASAKQIAEAVNNGSDDYAHIIAEADVHWRAMRKYWEQSEAFLYGPVDAHNIDPHVDSWPLDFNAMNSLLNNVAQMQDIEEAGIDYVRNNLGYALQGFHACEYLLFESEVVEGRTIGTGRAHAANLTKAESIYLLGVITDLVEQACLLEYCWAGELKEAKMTVLEEAEIEPWEDRYAEQMLNAGKPGSLYVNYQKVAEQIVSGCYTIAGEVADLKLGNPYLSNTPDQRDYIESPYSCTSTTDFKDNILSIKHAYCGAKEGDACLSDYIKSQDADLDERVRLAIDQSIAAIEAIEDFENHAQGDEKVKAAMDETSELERILHKEVEPLLSK
ncbi:MAG: hypothetical protein IJR74_04030 [Paludibacteraceae bacterium]|nr:hypothetical protein [Paludibacteraceae bacterium]